MRISVFVVKSTFNEVKQIEIFPEITIVIISIFLAKLFTMTPSQQKHYIFL